MLLFPENFITKIQMSSVSDSLNGQKAVQIQGQSLDFANRHNLGNTSISKNVKGNENLMDPETMELYSRARDQEKEIMSLKEQIARASLKESQLLNEKYALERKFAELRLALDEKQNEVITSASNELARRKSDLEVNVNLLNELKVAEDEKHIFTTSMVEILAEYGALPHVTNASALSSGIKHLHDQLQYKIRTSHARLADMNSMIGNNTRDDLVGKDVPVYNSMTGQGPANYSGVDGFSLDSHHSDPKRPQNLMQNSDMRQVRNNEYLGRPDIDRNIADGRNGFYSGSDQQAADQFSHPQMQATVGSYGSEEEVPGIEGFQIIGDAKPGCKLLGCGFPVRGTSLCMFQWVRHYPDGTRQYIEGATNPDYIVTADDVDKLIAVECIPMDEQGRQGDIVRIFANDNNKITCDEEMQEEINTYISQGQAIFNVLILLDHSDNWEPATLNLRRTGFHVNVERKNEAAFSERYSKDLLIKIPSGLSGQFVVTCPNGSSYLFSTSNNDIRMRDTIVLTLRFFQSKVYDEKKRSKA